MRPLKCVTRRFAFICCALALISAAASIGAEAQRTGAPDVLSIQLELGIPAPQTVNWEGQEYDIDSGIETLMGVIRDRHGSEVMRNRALVSLSLLFQHLAGRPCIEQLVGLYETASEQERVTIVVCLSGARDPRGIPVFVDALAQAKDTTTRVWAAHALASWNVRRGVAELVSLLDSKEIMPKPSTMYFVRDAASDSFINLNARKRWGFPHEQITQSIIDRLEGTGGDQFATAYATEVKAWFSKNEHRFPEWKPGDPLPKIPAPKAPAPESKAPEPKPQE